MAAGQGVGYKVFVSDLPGDCSEEELRAVFSTYGQVNRVHVLRAGRDGLRSAYVYYACAEAAEDAEEVLDGVYSIRRGVDKPIRVQRQGSCRDRAPSRAACGESAVKEEEAPSQMVEQASSWKEGEQAAGAGQQQPEQPLREKIWTEAGIVESHKLFVGCLPHDVAEEDVRAVFGVYGSVLQVHLMSHHPLKGRSAFVVYSQRQSAEDAIELLDNAYKMRSDWPFSLQVRWARKTCPRTTFGTWDAADSWDSVGWAKKTRSPTLGTWNVATSWDWARGSGVAWQSDWSGGWRGDDWWAGWGSSGLQSWGGAGGSRGSRAAGSGGAPAEAPSTRVHVFANLPSDIEEKSLKYVFETYGKVTGIRLERDAREAGHVEAFVDFSSPWDAETSLLSLDDAYEIRKGFGPLRLRLARPATEERPY